MNYEPLVLGCAAPFVVAVAALPFGAALTSFAAFFGLLCSCQSLSWIEAVRAHSRGHALSDALGRSRSSAVAGIHDEFDLTPLDACKLAERDA